MKMESRLNAHRKGVGNMKIQVLVRRWQFGSVGPAGEAGPDGACIGPWGRRAR